MVKNLLILRGLNNMKKLLWYLLAILLIGLIAYFISGKLVTLLGLGSAFFIVKKRKDNKNIDEKVGKNEKRNEEIDDDINSLKEKEEKLEEEYDKITEEGVDKVEEDDRNVADRLNDVLADADTSTRE